MADCSICLETMADTTHVTTNCGHKFHLKCLTQCDSDICPLCRQIVADIIPPNNNIKFEDMYGAINACPCCAAKPWSCETVGCENIICNCISDRSPFFVARNPIENNTILNSYIIQRGEYRCFNCYKDRDMRAVGYEYYDDDVLEELHFIYYCDTHDTIDETRYHIMNLLRNNTTNI